jgi:DNA invertase Pin-like site-specific DNA recombinase/phage host-nuclease inhibitor protein Gam
MNMNQNSKITALYSRLSVGDEDRDGGESNSIQNQKIFLESYAKQQQLINVKHYIDDDESGRFFDRSGYARMMDDVEKGKVGIVIMKDLTRWGRDYLQVGNAMEKFRRNNVRFIAINHGIDSADPNTLEFAPFINIMSEWYAKDISKKVKTGIKTKGTSGKPIMTEAPYGYVKDPSNKDFWLIDEEAAEIVRLIFRLFMDGKNRNQICVHLKESQILTPTFYLKQHDRGTSKSKNLNEANRYNWNKCTLTHILTRQEYCGDVVNFKTTKHFRDKHSRYVDRSEWQITANVHEPIVDRATFENVQRILANAPIKRPNGDGYIHPLSGLLFCKDCGTKMHIRTIHKNGQKYVTYCSEYAKGKARNPKCNSPHRIDVDMLMQTIASLLKRIAEFSLSNKDEFEALVKNSLALQQTDEMKKQQKRVPQITARLEQINKVINKLYEDNALGTIEQDRYQQLSQTYSEEYYALKKELEEIQGNLADYENTSGRAKKFIKLMESYCDFDELTPTAINEFISKIVIHERDVKRAKYAVQRVEVHFNYIGKFENELTHTELTESSEQERERMREEIENAKLEKCRAYHRAYSKEYRAKNLEKHREYDRMKAAEYRERKKAQAAL